MANTVSDTAEEQGVPRSRKGVETRARLVQAAKAVFERDGFLEARISDIAKEAGLSHGSYYHYFDSKEKVFREVAALQEAQLTAQPDHAPGATRTEASPVERIRTANRRYLERYRDEAQIMGVIEQVSRYDEQVNEVRMSRMKHFADRSEAAIRSWQAEGLVDADVNAAIAADALGAMVARFAELWLVQGYRQYPFDEAVDQLTRLWANALGLRDDPAVMPSVPAGRSTRRRR